MNEQQPSSPRQRLQQLLAIPDRQRTDAEWDELNELEIVLASVNRAGTPEPGARRNQAPASPEQKKNSSPPGQAKKPFKKFHKRPPKSSPA